MTSGNPSYVVPATIGSGNDEIRPAFVPPTTLVGINGGTDTLLTCPAFSKAGLSFHPRHRSNAAVPTRCCAPPVFGSSGRNSNRNSSSNGINGSSENDTDPFQVGDLVKGRFRVVGVLGRGANGVTFDAVDEMTRSRPVALKAVALRGMRNWKVLELFEREARALQNLDHPAIPKFVDSFEVDGDSDVVYVLVQRKARGASLQELVESGFRFSPERTTDLFRQLLEVLQYLGELNPVVLHRDVKPGNVVVDINSTESSSTGLSVSLVDFGGVNSGIAREAHDNVLTLIGTAGFMAPEQLGGTADVRSDLYACGATMLFVLSGQSPSDVAQRRLKLDVASVVSKEKRLALGNTYTVMQKLLEPAPEDRYQTARDALVALTAKPSLRRETETPGSSRGRNRGHRFRLFSDGDDFTDSDDDTSDSDGEFSRAGPRRRIVVSSTKGSALRVRQPAGSNVVLERDSSDRLFRVFIPRKGVTGQVLSSGAFALAWNGFVGFWTLGVLTGGASSAMALFSLPFWFAGAKMTKRVADDIRGTTELVISAGGGEREVYYFSLRTVGAFGKPKEIEGDARDLTEARVETSMYVNGRPVTSLVLREGANRHTMGEALDESEQVWLANEVNSFLTAKRR
jgi:eukaryotic-like serine/threonine-protein kinase